MDFSKAFDKVSHDHLRYTLDPTDLKPWNYIGSFLMGHLQKVITDGEALSAVLVTNGVTQLRFCPLVDSVLGFHR